MNTNEIKWDKQNLIPAIIQNTHTLNILMLGYMSEESIKQSLKTNEVTFFSRSKQKLWVKGETSGNKLIIDNIELDCDKDALLIKATPKGPTCHLGTESCFRVKDNLNINIFEKLESIIEDRKNSQLNNSYVASLFTKGIKEIAKKVTEEAGETSISAVSNDGRVIDESADLVFHLLVLLNASGFKMRDVMNELIKRSSN